MPNHHLQNQCKVMLTSIEIFSNSARQACIDDDGNISKSEYAFIKKLQKQLDSLSETLRNSP